MQGRREAADAFRDLADRMVVADADAAQWGAVTQALRQLAERLPAANDRSRFERLLRAEPDGHGDPGSFTPLPHPLGEGSSGVFPPIAWGHHEGGVDAEVTFGPAFEGPPGLVHGGFIAAGFDIVLSALGTDVLGRGVTRTLRLRYLKPTFLGQVLRFEVQAGDRVDRRLPLTGRLVDASGRVTVRAVAEFVSMDAGRFADRRSTLRSTG